MAFILLVQLVISAILTGLILIIQFTHYPAFRYISQDNWQEFHSFHSKSISYIVIPLMVSELFLSIYSVWLTPKINLWLALVFVVIIWLNTFLQAVPIHGRLASQKDLNLIQRLVKVNIIRTVLWILRSGLLGWVVWGGVYS